jgi:putative solute:sodium symporter small subunit
MKENNDIPKKSPGMTPQEYWKKNITCVLVLLAFWFVVSYGCGVLFVDELDKFRLPGTGYKLGFWFAQQGSIYAFLAIIWIYVWYMNRLDHRYAKGK